MQPKLSMSTPVRAPTMRLSCAQPRGKVLPAAARPRRHRQAPGIVCVLNATQDNFEQEVLKSELPVLVDFWATWCGPCRLVAPTMDWAEKAYDGRLKVVKVEADPNPALIEKYKVYGLPAFVVIKDGEMVPESKFEGAVTRKVLVSYLEKLGIKPVEATV